MWISILNIKRTCTNTKFMELEFINEFLIYRAAITEIVIFLKISFRKYIKSLYILCFVMPSLNFVIFSIKICLANTVYIYHPFYIKYSTHFVFYGMTKYLKMKNVKKKIFFIKLETIWKLIFIKLEKMQNKNITKIQRIKVFPVV